jgi:hypothetical protein
MRWVGTAATGLCLVLLAGASNPSQAAEPSQEKVFAQVEEVAAATDGSGQPQVWLRVLPAEANAGCVSNGGLQFVAEGGQAAWLDAVETLARSAKAAHFKLLVEYTVGDPVAQLAGTGSTRCRISRLSLGD